MVLKFPRTFTFPLNEASPCKNNLELKDTSPVETTVPLKEGETNVEYP